MDENIIFKLGLFGLTRQEAILYITLLSNQSMTGYELAKLTGISKSNTYGSLTGLVGKGAAYIISEEATKYLAVQVEEFCNNRINTLAEAKKELSCITFRNANTEGYITITGRQNIINKLRTMLEGTTQRVYLALHSELLMYFLPQLQELLRKNIKVVIITNAQVTLPGAILYYSDRIDDKIRIIVDSVEVFSGLPDKNCLYSKNENLFSIFKDMLTNEIEIIKMKEELH
ncbi:MAG: transcriptional regulator, TrmB [Herbinix sp.]|jgi:sugar-specific transcriptional regulator TrmB|nr:transcriptional regulator, TrmB [Herbinix sp.]